MNVNHSHIRRISQGIGSILILVFILTASFYIANQIQSDTELQVTLGKLGFIGAILVGVVSGFNVIIPFPPAVAAPIFESVGLSLPYIIFAFVLGTTVADVTGYWFGSMSRPFMMKRYPEILSRITSLHKKSGPWLLIAIFSYAAFAPFPNEAFLIPLALIGVPFASFLLPLFLGTIVYHTWSTFGVSSLFGILF